MIYLKRPYSLFFILLLIFNFTTFAIKLNDNGRITQTSVVRVIHIKTEAEIKNAIQTAKKQHLPIAIMGKQHSQGGQSLEPHAIELDMLDFNKVLSINTKTKQITVQSGITWRHLQEYINPYHLAVKSMQSPNVFTVGGSLSVNAHGDDFRAGSVGNSVVAFHLLLANGKKVLVTREINPKLWSAVIGGYGLFGVITDITLQLEDNDLYVSHYQELNIDKLPKYFRENILNNNDVKLFYSHLDITPGKYFLREMYLITYSATRIKQKEMILLEDPDKFNFFLAPMFNISRDHPFGKEVRWFLEEKIFSKRYHNQMVTRNNAMQKPVHFASEHHDQNKTDWLQEYFIPVGQLRPFINALRQTMLKNKVNLLNVTVRYVPAEKNSLLSYAKKDSFSVVIYFYQSLSSKNVAHTRVWTQKLINSALALEGNYYLPYQNFASAASFKQAYPGYKNIIKLKRIYDPRNRFVNIFYKKYFN